MPLLLRRGVGWRVAGQMLDRLECAMRWQGTDHKLYMYSRWLRINSRAATFAVSTDYQRSAGGVKWAGGVKSLAPARQAGGGEGGKWADVGAASIYGDRGQAASKVSRKALLLQT